MSISDRLPGNRQLETNKRSASIVIINTILFSISLLIMLLLQRLGMALELMVMAMLIVIGGLMITLSWLGRTITSPLFFFAGRFVEPAMSGIGGMADWIGGGLVILLLSAASLDQLILAPALLLGIVLQFTLFAASMHKSHTASIHGFLSWRYNSKLIGITAFSITFLVTTFMLIAEFLIAIDLLQFLTGYSEIFIAIVIVCIATIPTVFGGWLALHTFNTAVVLWCLMSMLFPAILVGVLPGIFDLISSPLGELKTLPKLDLTKYTISIFSSDGGLAAFVTAVVIGCGIATLPQGLSRISLVTKVRDSVQSLSWSALFVFLLLSAVPLSLNLIVEDQSPQSAEIAAELTHQTVIHILPYLALVMLAINGMCLTIWVLCSGTIRILRRTRNLNPDERSMFWIRSLSVLVAILLIVFGRSIQYSATQLIIDSILLSGSAFFWALYASSWLSNLGKLTIVCSIVLGALAAGIARFQYTLIPDLNIELSIFQIGLAGLICSGLPVWGVWIYRRYRSDSQFEPAPEILMNLRGTS